MFRSVGNINAILLLITVRLTSAPNLALKTTPVVWKQAKSAFLYIYRNVFFPRWLR